MQEQRRQPICDTARQQAHVDERYPPFSSPTRERTKREEEYDDSTKSSDDEDVGEVGRIFAECDVELPAEGANSSSSKPLMKSK